MNKKLALFIISFFFLAVPFFVFAQTFADFIEDKIEPVVSALISLVFALTLVLFLWGLARFILKADDPAERSKGKQLMIWGLIGMFVMFSVFGIVYMIRGAIFGGESQFGVPRVYLEEVREIDTSLTFSDQR